MNKEMTPLQALKKIKQARYFVDFELDVKVSEDYKKELNIIETALKNYQELLDRPCVLVGRTHGHTKALVDTISKNYKEIKVTNLEDEKKLKAFEIIKECFDLNGFDELVPNSKWFESEEKQDLLRKVLL